MKDNLLNKIQRREELNANMKFWRGNQSNEDQAEVLEAPETYDFDSLEVNLQSEPGNL